MQILSAADWNIANGRKILQPHLLLIIGRQRKLFQQDNAPPHTARVAIDYPHNGRRDLQITTQSNTSGMNCIDMYVNVCEAILKVILDEYVKFPEGEALKDVITGYEERWDFPNCAGSIDDSHIPIIAPKQSLGDYFNRKGFYSLILQGVCDHRYMLTDINSGWPDRVLDARVFAISDIYIQGDNGIPHMEQEDIRANRANLSPAQATFNYRLSRARMTIENAFGRLKGRWRCLQKR
ncbi:uncharacterized protein [Haliotis cracherodii]|uniref:uncharacterized protein n=1 Tax=Haliotis cracherodii TaxID=6455 RepID=UPI0039E73F67